MFSFPLNRKRFVSKTYVHISQDSYRFVLRCVYCIRKYVGQALPSLRKENNKIVPPPIPQVFSVRIDQFVMHSLVILGT